MDGLTYDGTISHWCYSFDCVFKSINQSTLLNHQHKNQTDKIMSLKHQTIQCCSLLCKALPHCFFQVLTIYIQTWHQIMWVPHCYRISYLPSFLWSAAISPSRGFRWYISQALCGVPLAVTGAYQVAFMAAESPCIPGGRGDRQTASQAV